MSHGVEILLVDDCQSNLLALESILGGLDASIVQTSNGQDAARKAKKHDFAVVVVDIHPPHINGVDTVCRLKSNSRNRELPVILLAAIEDLVEEGYPPFQVDYLVKPIDAFVLRGKVKLYVERHRERASLGKIDVEDDVCTKVPSERFGRPGGFLR